jgi:hypothetical protein
VIEGLYFRPKVDIIALINPSSFSYLVAREPAFSSCFMITLSNLLSKRSNLSFVLARSSVRFPIFSLILGMVDFLNIFSSDYTACNCSFSKLSSCDGWGSGRTSRTKRLDDAL